MKIIFPWPPKELSPNARVHHMAKARAVKSYRQVGWALTKEALKGRPYKPPESITVALEFWPPHKRRYDLDNCLARMKAGLDGMSQALGVDDSKFHLSIKFGAAGGKAGTVSVEVPGIVSQL